METINVIAILLSPIIAVLITLWYQSYKEKRDAKFRLFLTLMAHRKENPLTIEHVNSLNLIDVVFANHPKVLQLWHEYYNLLNTRPANVVAWENKHVELLSEMATELRYGKLKQTDILKFYTPQSHTDQLVMNAEMQKELLRVLKNSASFATVFKTTKKKI
jgi:hypothetical protein